MAKLSLVEAIEAATAEDLAEIRGRIAKLSGEVDSLRRAEKLLAAKLEPKAPSESVPRVKVTDDLLVKIEDFLRNRGPSTANEIAMEIGVGSRAVGQALGKSSWFKRHDKFKWTIAKAE